LKITILGYYGGYPTAKAGTTGFLIEESGYHLLLDCGSGVLTELERHLDPLQLNAVLLTHYHQDHIADVGVLQYYWQLRSGQRQEPILPIYGHTEDLLNFPSLTWTNATRAQAYDPDVPLKLGPWTITFQRTIHPVPTFAVRIVNASGKVLAFTADSAYFPELADFVQGADLLITDTNFNNQKTGKMWHLTSGQTGNLAMAAKAHRVLLSHLPQTIDHQQLLAEVKATAPTIPILLASRGLTLEV
jgi:ribonuclease BN (tRNA processing enzyme)